MAQDIVGGLFGPQPWEAYQAQQQAIGQAADKFAAQSPFEKASGLLYRGGAGMAEAAGGLLGLENPAIAQAQQRQAALQDLDVTSPEKIMEKAQQVSDPRMRMQLMMLADQKAKELAAIELERAKARREQFRMDEEFKWKKEQKLLELEQKAESARLRSEDARLNAQQRADAAREANQTRLLIAQMMQEARMAAIQAKGGIGNLEKPLTAAQQLKLRTQMGNDRKMVGQVESDAAFLTNAIDRLEKHPGLGGMTGWQSYLPSAPATGVTSGKAKAAETILAEIKGRTATLGRQIASQSGKLGNMAVQEWKIVSDSLASLDPASPEFKNQLKNLKAQMQGLEARIKEGYSTTYGDYLEAMPGFKIDGIPAPETPGAPLGKPSQEVWERGPDGKLRRKQ